MNKKHVRIFLIALVVLGITARVFCYTADVIDISGNKYFPALKEAIAEAKESIKVVMFLIELPQSKTKAKTQQLVDELIRAYERGVDVEVILDQNVDFVNRRPGSKWQARIRSMRAYKQLKEAGIRVYYDHASTYTHAKAIVIDEKKVIMGSTNWTDAALNRNIEANVLVESEEMAKSILEYFATIKTDEGIEKYIEFSGETISISWQFMQTPRSAPEMIAQHDERAFDIYLFLLKAFEKNSQAEFPLNYDVVAKHLGIDKKMERVAYRRQIIKVLKKLEGKYKLIKYEPHFGKDAEITLLDYNKLEDGDFGLPEDYFNFGWNRYLSLRAKFCYLINLANANVSDTQPFWSKSVNKIRRQFGNVGKEVIAKGMDELRRKRLIEVEYAALTRRVLTRREPKMYKVLQPYDFEGLKVELEKLKAKYTEKEYEKASNYAEIVFEEYNPEVIEDIIFKTKEYGKKKIKKAFNIVAKKNLDNPKRKYSYVVGILENWDK